MQAVPLDVRESASPEEVDVANGSSDEDEPERKSTTPPYQTTIVIIMYCLTLLATVDLIVVGMYLADTRETATSCIQLGDKNSLSALGAGEDLSKGRLLNSFCFIPPRVEYLDPSVNGSFCINTPTGSCTSKDGKAFRGIQIDEEGVPCGTHPGSGECVPPGSLSKQFKGTNLSCEWHPIFSNNKNERLKIPLDQIGETVRGYSPAQCLYFQKGLSHFAKLSLETSGTADVLFRIQDTALYLLIAIIVKELVRAYALISTLFASGARSPDKFRWFDNSPLMLVLVPLVPSYRNLVYITFYSAQTIPVMFQLIQPVATSLFALLLWGKNDFDTQYLDTVTLTMITLNLIYIFILLIKILLSGKLRPPQMPNNADLVRTLRSFRVTRKSTEREEMEKMEAGPVSPKRAKSCMGRMRQFLRKYHLPIAVFLCFVNAADLATDGLFLYDMLTAQCLQDGFTLATDNYCKLGPPLLLTSKNISTIGCPGYQPDPVYVIDDQKFEVNCPSPRELAAKFPDCVFRQADDDCKITNGAPYNATASPVTVLIQDIDDINNCRQSGCAYFGSDFDASTKWARDAFRGSNNNNTIFVDLLWFAASILILKETIKFSILIGSLFYPKLRLPNNFKYAQNFPILLFFLPSKRYQDLVGQLASGHYHLTWAIGIDIFLEDVPQAGLSLWVLAVNGLSASPNSTIYSLLMSLFSLFLSSLRFFVLSIKQIKRNLKNFSREMSAIAHAITEEDMKATNPKASRVYGFESASASDAEEEEKAEHAKGADPAAV